MKTFAFATALLTTLSLSGAAVAQDDANWVHAIALDGTPKYEAGFEMFDYVNPNAPKGGTVRLPALGGFDTFNPILPQGESATGLGLVYETLTTQSADENSVAYGLLAEAFSYPDDFSSVTFRLNPRARWQDGEPVTAEDVLWSFEQVMEISPIYAEYYASVEDAEITGEGEITFFFSEAGNRELPSIMGQLLVLPKHWWEGENAEGEPRNIGASTLELPMGSGPYTLSSFDAGRTVTYTRDPDYWGADEPVNVGTSNFDEYRIEYFRDTTVMFEAFKADEFDWWTENIARRWATGYDFPAVNDDRVVLETFENGYNASGVMWGFVPNQRKEKFQDPRVREALNYAFDFQELNRTLFYEQYQRIDSYFFGTDLAAPDGPPTGLELEILEEVRDLIPASVFDARFANPTGGSEEALRANLQEALRLFNEAGYTLEGTQLVDANGEQFSFEILSYDNTIEPVALHWADNLNAIGANVTLRVVDTPQYTNLVRSFDYDVIYTRWAQSLSPGNEQRYFWGSSSADEQGSQNYAGISDPGVDALIEKIVLAPDRETLVAATHALDRVLLAMNNVVPSYTITYARTARWDRFSHPETLPEFSIGFPDVWWWDEEKAAATGGNSQ
ncbi:extracellular solute-binding protein [Pelagibacterium flavum]|uniref:Extracellular solute-binding protein n=1 Tax=Pelagibacterium flavum TaxID=2984530 RepID=A0ABY6IPH7_9HYPH|nr:extracellular solute-binding protein [Pelagibacterium sp. YIM 151497]UYQ71227.1 extracellular solute-binding protein [Pelagibacterium sp. YIM 151497]